MEIQTALFPIQCNICYITLVIIMHISKIIVFQKFKDKIKVFVFLQIDNIIVNVIFNMTTILTDEKAL